MFHQRPLKKLTVVLAVVAFAVLKISGFGGFVSYIAVMVVGGIAFVLINRFAPTRDWYKNEDEESGAVSLNISGPKSDE